MARARRGPAANESAGSASATSAPTKIAPIHWKLIVDGIHAHPCACVPFLGAGANVSGAGYAGLPLGSDVALELAAILTERDVATLKKLAWAGDSALSTTTTSGGRRCSTSPARDAARAAARAVLRPVRGVLPRTAAT